MKGQLTGMRGVLCRAQQRCEGVHCPHHAPEVRVFLGYFGHRCYAPITLQFGGREIRASALVDSGSTLNVLPHDVGLQLGTEQLNQEPAASLVPLTRPNSSIAPRGDDPMPAAGTVKRCCVPSTPG